MVTREPDEAPAGSFDGEDLDLSSGLIFALDVCLSDVEVGQVLELTSTNPALAHELPAWCRGTGHELVGAEPDGSRTRYPDPARRARLADVQGSAGLGRLARVPSRRVRHAGLARRQGGARSPPEPTPPPGSLLAGPVVEPGAPAFPYTETDRDRLWAHNVASLYEQATAAQWDASVDIRWGDLRPLPTHVERAVCQIMTHLAENEYAALYVPARFLPRIHPHFTEVVLFLSTQVVDEARHIEAFTKRALANGGGLQFSTAMTQTSLKSLLEQEDFTQASFLLVGARRGDVPRVPRVRRAVRPGPGHGRHRPPGPCRRGAPRGVRRRARAARTRGGSGPRRRAPNGRGAARRVPRRRQRAEPACRGGSRGPRRRWRHLEQDPGRGPGGP